MLYYELFKKIGLKLIKESNNDDIVNNITKEEEKIKIENKEKTEKKHMKKFQMNLKVNQIKLIQLLTNKNK